MIPCVVLNNTGQPLAVVEAERGLVLLLTGEAILREALPNRKFRSVNQEFPVPTRIELREYRHTGARYYGAATLNQRNLFIRDNFRCVYCGRHVTELNYDAQAGPVEYLTRDHVLPVSRGGQDTWLNVVTACSTCNHQKDDRTLEEIEELLFEAQVRHEEAVARGLTDAAARAAEEMQRWSRLVLKSRPYEATVREIMEKRQYRLERSAA